MFITIEKVASKEGQEKEHNEQKRSCLKCKQKKETILRLEVSLAKLWNENSDLKQQLESEQHITRESQDERMGKLKRVRFETQPGARPKLPEPASRGLVSVAPHR